MRPIDPQTDQLGACASCLMPLVAPIWGGLWLCDVCFAAINEEAESYGLVGSAGWRTAQRRAIDRHVTRHGHYVRYPSVEFRAGG